MSRPGRGGQCRHFSYAELEGLWINAGGPPRLSPTMAAIAMAESAGFSCAHNPSGASGLWQILGNPFPGNPMDAATNARMAVAKWKSQGLGAWATWPNPARGMIRRGIPPAGSVGGNIGGPYVNPLAKIRGLKAERIDQGVDYAGSGPVGAIGPGVITYAATGPTGWGPPAGPAPGGFIKERLTSGALAGRYVYVAEGVYPTVRVGQRVRAGQEVARMVAPIEIGFASPGGGTAALAGGASGATPEGVAFSDLLKQLGAPPGVGPTKISGGPSWLQQFLAGVNVGTQGPQGPNLPGLGGVASAISGIGSTLAGLATAIDWLLHPYNWVRIFAGLAGGSLVLVGVYQLSHTGQRTAALPVGIMLVGAGGVLLFVAFHNLPGQPSNISELAGSLRDVAQAASAGHKTGVMP